MMNSHLTEPEIHLHLAPLTRLGGVRVWVQYGTNILLDRIKLKGGQPEKFAASVDALFSSPTRPEPVSQIVLGYDEGHLVAVACKRMRLCVFLPQLLDLEAVSRAANRVVQELTQAYERAADRVLHSATSGEWHRSRAFGQDAQVMLPAESASANSTESPFRVVPEESEPKAGMDETESPVGGD